MADIPKSWWRRVLDLPPSETEIEAEQARQAVAAARQQAARDRKRARVEAREKKAEERERLAAERKARAEARRIAAEERQRLAFEARFERVCARHRRAALKNVLLNHGWQERRATLAVPISDEEWFSTVETAGAVVFGLPMYERPEPDPDDELVGDVDLYPAWMAPPANFTCDECGRLADTLDASRALVEAVEATSLPFPTFEQWRGLEKALRPADFQASLGIGYESAVALLDDGVRRGLFERRGRGYGVRPNSRCAQCYEGMRTVATEPSRTSARDPVPAQLRFRVLQRDGFRCQYCGRSARDGATLHLDHVVPVVAGGETSEDNLITACEMCNLGKSSEEVV